ncbi:hypothetical protein L210DRAFT_3651067 [Boletus edulis BED1]|uniref:Uncharacterized protein n=1 Tax=Boletus edulis BED1 TaxID=1328754 RepID=A0AAD4G9K9_BOLED|nr:hypothetical protein L210DRAFT_3651067 [Boletus edulis BED1]
MASQPSQSGTSSEPIFDNRDGVPTWVSSTRDIQYTIDSEPRDAQCTSPVNDDDDDDDNKEDTWSSNPTESPGPTRILTAENNGDVATLSNDVDVEVKTNGEEAEQEQETVKLSDDECSIAEASKLEEGAVAEMSGPRLLENPSQISIASDASSSQSRDEMYKK